MTTHIIAELKSSCKTIKWKIFNSETAVPKEYEVYSEVQEWEQPNFKWYVLDTIRLFDENWEARIYALPKISKDSNRCPILANNEEWEAVKKMWNENKELRECKEKRNRKEAEELKEFAWLSKRFVSKTLYNFEPLTETHKKVVKILQEYCASYQQWDTDKWLYLCGGVGVWKTHLIAWVIDELCNKRVRCLYKSVPTLLNEIKDTFDTGRDSQRRIIDRCSRVDVLVLDDIGTEKPTDRVAEILYTIINNRYENMKTTIFTSNLKVPELWDRLNPRISDRIYDMCQILDLSRITKSYRWR